MAYYDDNEKAIYHTCKNCETGRAIPAERKKPGMWPGAMRCADCDDRALQGTCTLDTDGGNQ